MFLSIDELVKNFPWEIEEKRKRKKIEEKKKKC